VRKVSPNGIITTVAGIGNNSSYSGDGGPATSAGMKAPEGIAIDASGNLYIADVGSNVIRKVNKNGIISTVAGNGTFGYSGDGGPATGAQLGSSAAVTVDSSGNLYIGDENNHVVRKVDSNGVITTIVGNGTYGFSGDGGPATSAQLSYAQGVAVDTAGNLYIADYGNMRIRKVGSSPVSVPTATPFFDPPAGNYNYGQLVTISDTTAGAVIYYTTDRSTPTTSSAVYNGPITLTQTENISAIALAPGYTQSAVAEAIYNMNPRAQTITFGAPPVVTFTGTGKLTATATSGLPVAFGSLTPNICSVAGSVVTGIARGICTVTANQPGDASYLAAPQVDQVFTIGEGTITQVTPSSAKAGVQITIIGTNFGITPSGVSFIIAGSTTAATILSGSDAAVTVLVPNITPGAVMIVVTGSNGLNSNSFPFTVLSSVPSITSVTPGSGKAGTQVTITGVNFGANPSGIAFTVGGSTVPATILSGSDTSITTTVPTIAPGAGSIVVTASNNIYTVPFPFTVLSSAPQITAVTPGSAKTAAQVTITGVNFGAHPTGVLFTVGTSTVAGTIVSGSDTSVTATVPNLIAGAGSVVVVSGSAIDSNAFPFTILLSSQTIAFGPAPTLIYGGSAVVSATATSGLPVVFTSSTPTVCKVAGNTVTGIAVGTCTVTANQAGNSYYAPATPVSQNLSVSAKVLAVSADNKSKTVGAANPAFTVTYSGFVNGDSVAVLSGSPALSTSATISSVAGQYPIAAAQGTLSATNYSFTFVNGTLSVLAPPAVVITSTSTFTQSAGGYQEVITVTNTGNANASNVKLTTASLGSASGSPLPKNLGNLAAGGGSATITLTFPASAGPSATTVVAKTAGTFAGGTFNTSIRIKLP